MLIEILINSEKGLPRHPISSSGVHGVGGGVYSIIPQLAENLVAAHLGAKFFWRKYHEVDFLHDKVPIEVKYRERPDEIDGALKAAKQLGSNRLVVVTKDLERKERLNEINVSFTPLWKLLLTAGGPRAY